MVPQASTQVRKMAFLLFLPPPLNFVSVFYEKSKRKPSATLVLQALSEELSPLISSPLAMLPFFVMN